MKKISVIFITIALFIGIVSFSSNVYTAKEVPSVMYQFLTKLVKLSPYMYDQEAFMSKKNDTFIKDTLSDMKGYAKGLKNHKRLNTPGYEKSADYFIDQISHTHQSFSQGNKKFAYRLFRSTLHACSSCHNQESSKYSMSWNLTDFALPENDFERASFYYTVRGYDQSWDLFHNVLDTHTKHKNLQNIEISLDRMLSIALRIERDPQKLVKVLESIPKTKALSSELQNQITLWLSELHRIKSYEGQTYLQKDAQEFDQYIDQLYRDIYPFPKEGRSRKVVMEYGAGLMFEFVNNRPSDVTQKILFWLGISNITLDHFESGLLGEKFLAQCIEDYPVTLVSHQCYKGLEDQWVIGFSGSSGIHLPIDLEKKLTTYRKKLGLDELWYQ